MAPLHSFARIATALLLLAVPQFALAEPGDVDLTFNANIGVKVPNPQVYNPALQPDGKIVIGKAAGTVAVRLNPDGSADPAFTAAQPGVNGTNLFCTAIQPDGKILIGGGGNNTLTVFLHRHNTDGTLDPAFDAKLTLTAKDDSSVRCITLLNDGRVLIGGGFSILGGPSRIARLQPDGSLDATFNANANGIVYSLAVQPDGKTVITGGFTTVGGTARNHVARLNPDGSLDSTFNPIADNLVYTVALQADGKVLIGGSFATVNGVARVALARLNADGTLDTSFSTPDTTLSPAWSTALQANGQILVVGSGYNLTRLNVDGSEPRVRFGPMLGVAQSLCLQADGKPIVAGPFNPTSGFDHYYVARLENDLATQALSVPNAAQVRWERGGTSPEAQAVSFELSTDGGGTWTLLGFANRIAGGWELSGPHLPVTGIIRARARTATGYGNGSSSLLETVRAYTLPAPPTVTTLSPASRNSSSEQLAATVNPNGIKGMIHFEYSADPALATAVVTPDLPYSAGIADLSFAQIINDLAPASVYYCRAVATSANGTTQGDTVAFITTGTPGDIWRYQHFGAAWQGVSFAADSDGDGVTNLAEYAFGGDPLAPDAVAILPTLDVSGGRLRITFTRDPAHADIASIIVQASNDLVTWSALAESSYGGATQSLVVGANVSESALGARRQVQVTDSVPIAAQPRRALRVKLTR